MHGLIVGGDDPRRAGYSDELRHGCRNSNSVSHHTSRVIGPTFARSTRRRRAVLSLSTQPESFGRSVLEALAIGTPVLGFDHAALARSSVN